MDDNCIPSCMNHRSPEVGWLDLNLGFFFNVEGSIRDCQGLKACCISKDHVFSLHKVEESTRYFQYTYKRLWLKTEPCRGEEEAGRSIEEVEIEH